MVRAAKIRASEGDATNYMPRLRLLPPFLVLTAVALARTAIAASSAGAPSGGTDGASPPPGEEIVVVGQRPAQAEAASAPGAAVTTVDASRFAGEAKGVAELLATSPGVAVTEHGGPGQAATVSIRGSGAEHVKVLLDGLPLNTAAGGAVDLSSIPAAWISRIEIVRGTEGVHHGSGALGGVVNVVTPRASAAGTSAAVTAGSLDTWRAEAQAGAGGERWGLLGTATGVTTSGRFRFEHDQTPALSTDPVQVQTRTNAESRVAGALVKGFALAGGGRLDALAQLTAGDRGLPGSPYHPTADDWQRDARGVAALRFRRTAGERLALSAGAWARIDRLDARLADLGGLPTRQRGAAGAASASAEWSVERLALSAGAEAGGERLDAAGVGGRSRATVAAILTGETTALGGRLRAGPGVRLERTGAYSGVSAKLGGSLALAGPLSLRASAGRTYRVPSFAELYLQQGVVAPNPDLRPEVGLGGDAALVAEGRLGMVSLGTFATLYRDLVVYQSVSFRRLAPVNADRAIMRGFEVEAAAAPLFRVAGLTGGLSYTFTDSENLRGVPDVVGKDVTRHPRHRLYGRLGIGGAAAGAHAEVQWVSRQFVDLRNEGVIPASFTLGAGGSVRVLRSPDVHLALELRNLLDDRSLQDSYGYPLPGRTVFVTVRAGSPDARRTR